MSRLELLSRTIPYIAFTKAKALDAGSGPTSLGFLINQYLEEFWAVSIDPEEISALKAKIAKLAPKDSSVIDMGCGEGEDSLFLDDTVDYI